MFGFSAPVDIQIAFKGEEERKMVEVKVDKDRREKFPLYFDGETVAGKVCCLVKPTMLYEIFSRKDNIEVSHTKLSLLVRLIA